MTPTMSTLPMIGSVAGIVGILAPALLVASLAAWHWRLVPQRVLHVVVALLVAYGLQSIAFALLASYLYANAHSIANALVVPGHALALSAAVGIAIALPLLRALALALALQRSAATP